jgi:DNA-binding response OmpR family regulator
VVNRPRVLVANPDPGIRRLLRRHFDNAGYSVVAAELGRTVLDLLRRSALDVVILSSEMGDIRGVDLVSRAHAITSAPLLVLMPTKSAVTPGEILDAGADDCLDEPFLLEELAARTRRLLHRSGVCLGPLVLRIGLGQLEINALERTVRLNDKSLVLSRKEFDLLGALAAARGSTLSHDQILHEVWGGEYTSARQNLRRLVSSLRRKIEPEPKLPICLVSIRGSGYRLAIPMDPAEDALA